MDSTTLHRSATSIAEENARFMTRVYLWMTMAILFTGLVAYYVSATPALIEVILMNRFVFYGLFIAQLASVFVLSGFINKLSGLMCTVLYFLYAAMVGLTLSVIFLVYTAESIQSAFFVTAFGFAGLSGFGLVTKRDLGPLGTFCMMGLWGLIGFALITLFIPSLMTSTASKIYGIIGVIVFAGLTAYDTQKIKQMNIIGNEGTEEDHKETIRGALTLYLDFINLFLHILRLMGNRRR